MSDFIDLGSKPAEPSEARKPSEPYYPSLHISGPNHLDLPEEGTATIRFRKGDSGERKRGGKTEYYCDLEVLGFKPDSDSKTRDAPQGPKFGESLDRAIAKRAEPSEDED